MSKTRYEEYGNSKNTLPFVLHTDLKRTQIICSDEANWHENLEIEVCIGGSGYVLIDGKKYTFSKGDIIVVNSNAIHNTGTTSDLVYSCVIIDNEFCKELDINPSLLQFETRFKNDYILEQFSKLAETYRSNDDICRKAKMEINIINILIELRERHTVAVDASVEDMSFKKVRQLIKFIRENYSQKLSLDQISKYLLTDKYTLSREFKRLTKQTIVEYINRYRCQKALEFIEAGENVSNAAIICGFNNMSFFTKIFKRYVGVLPSEIKKNKFTASLTDGNNQRKL